jgi:hypothetical protein
MKQQDNTTQREGTVVSQRYSAANEGKVVGWVAINDVQGGRRVVDSEEQSPYHVFGGRRVVASAKRMSRDL